MESILAAAYVNIQEGEADQLTDAAASVFGGVREGKRLNNSNVLPLFRFFCHFFDITSVTTL